MRDFEQMTSHDYFCRNKIKFVVAILIGVFAFAYWQTILQPSQLQKKVEAQHLSYIDGFREGWEWECDHVFEPAVLYASGRGYSEVWCKSLHSQILAESSYKKEKKGITATYGSITSANQYGQGAGAWAVIDAVFSYTPYLCWGSECFTKTDVVDRLEYEIEQSWMQEESLGFP